MNIGDKVVFSGPYGTEQGKVVAVNGDKVKVRSAAGQVHTVTADKVELMKSYLSKSIKNKLA